ncbi:hypothetical protein GCM10029964_126910 [Kibdelosporangium lantanae]
MLHGFIWPRPAGTCLLISAVCDEFPPLCPGSMTTTLPAGTAAVDDVDEGTEDEDGESDEGGGSGTAEDVDDAGEEAAGAGLASGFPQAAANASTAMAARAARGEVGTRTRLVLGAASPT